MSIVDVTAIVGSFSSDVAAGVHLFRALLRVRDVAMPWPATEARAA